MKKFARILKIKLMIGIIIPIVILVVIIGGYYVIKGLVQKIGNDICIAIGKITKVTQDGEEYHYTIDDTELGKALENIRQAVGDTELLKLSGEITPNMTEAQKKEARELYLRAFLKAEYMSTSIDISNGVVRDYGKNEYQGTVKIQRSPAPGQQQPTNLIYIPLEQLQAMVEKKDTTASNYFSMSKETGLLYYVAWTKTIQKANEATTKEEYTMELRQINYLEMINGLGMSFNFLMSLAQTTDNPNFALELANLVLKKETNIIITLQDNINTETTLITKKHDEKIETTVKKTGSSAKTSTKIEGTFTQTETKIMEEHNPVPLITSANTWIAVFVNEYILTEQTVANGQAYYEYGIDGKTTTLPDEYIGTEGPTTETETLYNGKEIETTTTIKTTAINRTENMKKTEEYITWMPGPYKKDSKEEQILEIFKKEYVLPNTGRMAQSPVGELQNNYMFLFQLLEENGDYKYEEIIRYLLYKLSGEQINYGVTELSFTGYSPLDPSHSGLYPEFGSSMAGQETGFWWPIGGADTTWEDTETGSKMFAKGTPTATGISAYFLDPTYLAKIGIPHRAIDIIRGPNDSTVGSTDYVIATASGTVVYANFDPKGIYGYQVLIKHEVNGNVIYSHYGHMKAGSVRVKTGEKVYQGQVIGEMGDTGRVTGKHLDFEIRLTDNYNDTVNPLDYVSATGSRQEGVTIDPAINFVVALGQQGAATTVTDEAELKRILGYYNSTLASQASAFLYAQNTYGVNALFLASIAVIECGGGTAGGVAKNANNWFNVSSNSSQNSYQQGYYDDGSPRYWVIYNSPADSIIGCARLLNTSDNYFAGQKYTISGISAKYCPPGGAWANAVGNQMKYFLSKM